MERLWKRGRLCGKDPHNHSRLTLISKSVEQVYKPGFLVPRGAKSWHEGAERRKSIGVKQIPCIEDFAYGEAGLLGEGWLRRWDSNPQPSG